MTAGQVRIIGGQWKRSKLPVLNREGLRPTPDRVRETLFNWLGATLPGWRCLDAYAGTGALGFEAASRGASQVTLIERDAALIANLRATQTKLQASQVRIETAQALTWMAHCAPASFELIFLDPPFHPPCFERAVQTAARLIVPAGLIYLEADRPFASTDFEMQNLTLHRKGQAGLVHYHLFQCQPKLEEPSA